jgi:hypothetical protein
MSIIADLHCWRGKATLRNTDKRTQDSECPKANAILVTFLFILIATYDFSITCTSINFKKNHSLQPNLSVQDIRLKTSYAETCSEFVV